MSDKKTLEQEMTEQHALINDGHYYSQYSLAIGAR